MNLQQFSNEKLIVNIETLVRNERKITLEILEYFREIDSRKSFAELGYSSLFEFATKHLRYSDSAAGRRIASMRLIKNCHNEVSSSLAKGETTLSTLSKISTFVHAKEKHIGQKVSELEKQQIIRETKGKNIKEVNLMLAKKSAELKIPPKESFEETVTHSLEELTILKFAISKETLKKLEKVKAIYSNKNKTKLNEIFDALLDQVIDEDKIEKEKKSKTKVASTPVAGVKKSRYVAVQTKREIYLRSNSTCEYVSHINGKRCESNKFLHFAHGKAFSKGGEQTVDNLKLYCFQHNSFDAYQEFGRSFIKSKIEKNFLDKCFANEFIRYF